MLSELWDFITTKSSSQARKEGYLYHAIALAHRARRCEKYWQTHLEHCREQVAKIPSAEKLVVFGSGLLLETPLEILVQKFNQITLVDIVHTKETRAKVERFCQSLKTRISLVEMDLNKDFFTEKAEFYISANILSQIAFVSTQKWLKEQIAEEEIEKRTADLQARHLEQLLNVSNHGMVFSDFQMQILDLQNKVIEEKSTVAESLKLKWSKTWSWDLAPAPELSKDYSVRLIVGCRTEDTQTTRQIFLNSHQ